MAKIIIAGTRTLTPSNLTIEKGLEALNFNPEQDEVIQGGAKGVDLAAKEYCEENGIICTEYPAKWDSIGLPDAVIKTNHQGKRYNAKAGHDRNALMAQDGDALLLIWDGKSPGSKNMKTQMVALGKKVHEIIIKE